MTDNTLRETAPLLPPRPPSNPASHAADRALLNELEPEAGRLYHRHLRVAQKMALANGSNSDRLVRAG